MSLILPYEKIWDMPLGGTSDEKQAPHWAGNLIWGFLVFVFKICFRYRVDNRESIRGFDKESGVVVVANHTSFLDVAFMYLATRPQQWLRFMGRERDVYKRQGRGRGDAGRAAGRRRRRRRRAGALRPHGQGCR